MAKSQSLSTFNGVTIAPATYRHENFASLEVAFKRALTHYLYPTANASEFDHQSLPKFVIPFAVGLRSLSTDIKDLTSEQKRDVFRAFSRAKRIIEIVNDLGIPHDHPAAELAMGVYVTNFVEKDILSIINNPTERARDKSQLSKFYQFKDRVDRKLDAFFDANQTAKKGFVVALSSRSGSLHEYFSDPNKDGVKVSRYYPLTVCQAIARELNIRAIKYAYERDSKGLLKLEGLTILIAIIVPRVVARSERRLLGLSNEILNHVSPDSVFKKTGYLILHSLFPNLITKAQHNNFLDKLDVAKLWTYKDQALTKLQQLATSAELSIQQRRACNFLAEKLGELEMPQLQKELPIKA